MVFPLFLVSYSNPHFTSNSLRVVVTIFSLRGPSTRIYSNIKIAMIIVCAACWRNNEKLGFLNDSLLTEVKFDETHR